MASFKKYLRDLDNEQSVVYTFGRFNLFTKGHQELWKFVSKEARKVKGDGIIFTSFVQNQKKNPLAPQDKIMYIRKVLPKGLRISDDTTLKTPFQILEDLIKKGYTNIKFVVGADRRNDFNDMYKYAKQWSDGEARLQIVSFSGNRRIGDYSGTKMREYVKENDFEGFRNDLPDGFTEKEAREIFEKTKIGLGLDV
jgi:hypothetical protein